MPEPANDATIAWRLGWYHGHHEIISQSNIRMSCTGLPCALQQHESHWSDGYGVGCWDAESQLNGSNKNDRRPIKREVDDKVIAWKLGWNSGYEDTVAGHSDKFDPTVCHSSYMDDGRESGIRDAKELVERIGRNQGAKR